MRCLLFAKRTAKEILRDPLNLFFGLGFPIILIVLLSTIQKNVPIPIFEIESLTPGITVFGLSFMALFSANLIAKDRETAFLQRLYATPLTATDFILGYALPLVPIALLQSLICYLVALCFGLPFSIHILYAILINIPIVFFFIALGLLFGSILGIKQVGGICGALLTNLTGWLSNIWFDLSLVGKGFETFANLLPFVHAVKLGQAVLNVQYDGILVHLLWVLGYASVATLLAIYLFLRQMHKQ